MATANPFRFSTKYQDDESDLLYYGYRYYNASTGRWLNHDPIEEDGGVNLYGFVRNQPLQAVDRLGLEIPPPSGYPPPDPCWEFEAWYENQTKDLSWLSSLPNCPCELFFVCSRSGKVLADNPDPNVWNDPTDKGMGVHAGASWDMRSRPSSRGAAQQCSYDANGLLITWGPGAGTADRYADLLNHVADDYIPVMWAIQCDKQKGNNDCIEKYLEVRPTNNGDNCPRNPPG